MGSKLRRLRVKAGVTGLSHQKAQREAARRKERAQPAVQARPLVGGANGPLGRLRSLDELQVALDRRHERKSAEMERLLADMGQRARENRENAQAGHIERELAEEIAAAGAGWPDVAPFHVADYLSPLQAKAAGLGEVCRVCGKARPAAVNSDAEMVELNARLLAMVGPERAAELSADFDAAAAASGSTRAEAWRDGMAKLWARLSDPSLGRPFEAESIELRIGGRTFKAVDPDLLEYSTEPESPAPVTSAPEPEPTRPPAAGMRIARSSRSRILPLLAFAMMAGLAVPPKGDR